MIEPRLGRILTVRFNRLVWSTLAAYAGLVITVFAAMNELSLRRSLEEAADVIESLLGLYADPGGERTTVAPVMLADQLLGMGERFLITRTVSSDGAGRKVYFLSPTMPAKEIESLAAGASAGEVREQVVSVIAERGRWRYRVLHRRASEFDIFVAGSRLPGVLALLGLGGAALLLLPLTALVARVSSGRAVTRALAPMARVVEETQAIGPHDLSRRVGTPTGVAEVTELANALNRLIERVERSHRALEAFTADASHELRTPLTHLRAQAQWALADNRAVDEMHESLAAITREVEQTARMVEDLLLIARGDNRQLPMENLEFDLVPLVLEVEEIAQAMGASRELEVRADVNDPARAIGDPNRARQVLLNLASNAVRYTVDGTVTFSLDRADGMIGVAVRDTGCGIGPDHLDHIFDRFYRVDRSRSRAHGGAGLGLTIARLLAELQGGNISVRSSPGEGSTFVFWLPTTGGGPVA